jgi:hypothetical protein
MTGGNQQEELEKLESEFLSLLAFAGELNVVSSKVAASGRVREYPLSWLTGTVIRRLSDNAQGKLKLVGSLLDGARTMIAKGVDATVFLRRLPADLTRLAGYLEAIRDVKGERSAIGNSAKKARTEEWKLTARALYMSKKWHTKSQAAAQIAPKVNRLPDTVQKFLYTIK